MTADQGHGRGCLSVVVAVSDRVPPKGVGTRDTVARTASGTRWGHGGDTGHGRSR
jgi:hypothetical protein